MFVVHFSQISVIEELDTNAGKQLSRAATDVKLTMVLKKGTTFRYIHL